MSRKNDTHKVMCKNSADEIKNMYKSMKYECEESSFKSNEIEC